MIVTDIMVHCKIDFVWKFCEFLLYLFICFIIKLFKTFLVLLSFLEALNYHYIWIVLIIKTWAVMNEKLLKMAA